MYSLQIYLERKKRSKQNQYFHHNLLLLKWRSIFLNKNWMLTTKLINTRHFEVPSKIIIISWSHLFFLFYFSCLLEKLWGCNHTKQTWLINTLWKVEIQLYIHINIFIIWVFFLADPSKESNLARMPIENNF